MLYASTRSFYAEAEVWFCKIDGVLSLQIYDFFYKKKVNEDRKIFFLVRRKLIAQEEDYGYENFL